MRRSWPHGTSPLLLLAFTTLFSLGLSFPLQDHTRVAERLYDAENVLQTPGGALFVSGGDGVFWLRGDSTENTYDAVPMLPQREYALGMAMLGGRLFVATEKSLWMSAPRDLDSALSKDPLSHDLPPFLKVFDMPRNISLPNGMAADPTQNLLFVADSAYTNLLHGGSVFALQVGNVTADDPTAVHVSWSHTVANKPDVMHPNGLRWHARDQSIYISDGGAIKRIAMDGGLATSVSVVVRTKQLTPTVFDDLFVFDGPNEHAWIGACDILRGTLQFYDAATGAEMGHTTPSEALHMPSAWMPLGGHTPNSAFMRVVITNKGVLRVRDAPWGDFVSIAVLNVSAEERVLV